VALSVLLIDDDPTFRALARRVLTLSGCEIAGEADCGESGVSSADRLRPDAILVDVGLPDADGLSLAAHLSALPWRPRVLVTSVDADATSDEAARGNGALGFVPKHELPGAGLSLLLGDR
jgi:DNA-binding NarL/FixJ family response regulator